MSRERLLRAQSGHSFVRKKTYFCEWQAIHLFNGAVMRLMLRSAADLSSKRNSRPQAQHGNCLVNRVERRVVQVLYTWCQRKVF